MSVKKILWSESIRSRVETGQPQFLARASLKAYSASDYSGFLDLVARENLDLILLESDSGELPAIEICRRLSGDETTRAVPILVLSRNGEDTESLEAAGCAGVLDGRSDPKLLQEKIAAALGMRLRRHPRHELILPVSRGRIFHEFLGYSSTVSEGGMGFDTIVRIREDDHLPLRIYRNSEEKPINALGRVCGVRPNLDSGIGYAVGVEFVKMAAADRDRLADLFPPDPCVTWGPDTPSTD